MARRSARTANVNMLNQVRNLDYTAPDDPRSQLKDVACERLAAEAAKLRPRSGRDQVGVATRSALCLLGRRVLALDAEVDKLDKLDNMLGRLVENTAPRLLEVFGVGVSTAASLLVTAGDNPARIRSEAAWAYLCGVAPIPASSGKIATSTS